jgi:hypothetical protein
MGDLINQILSLSKKERLKIAMQILLSIQDEEENALEWHIRELDKFQDSLKDGEVQYLSEKDFWTDLILSTSSDPARHP